MDPVQDKYIQLIYIMKTSITLHQITDIVTKITTFTTDQFQSIVGEVVMTTIMIVKSDHEVISIK